MSGFTERISGDVKIKHHSTSSMIEIIVDSTDPTDGKPYNNYLWVDYEEFQDLYNALQTFVNDDGTKEFPLT